MSAPILRLRGASLERDGAAVLGPLDLEVHRRELLAIVGPAGTGKSTLLRALAGQELAPHRLRGEWAAPDPSDVVLVPQRARSRVLPEAGLPAEFRSAFASGARVLLLDEPTRGVAEDDRTDLVAMLRAFVDAVGTAIVVSHDVSFVRALPGRVALLCDGSFDCIAPTERFFRSPPTELAARFVAHGSCWPRTARKRAELPTSFAWLEPDRLGGTGAPGLLRPLEVDLASFAEAGVTLLVNLTETAPKAAALAEVGIASLHAAVPDMGAPSIARASQVCRAIEREHERGGCAVVHCKAGLGRTGTLLAAFLVWRGARPEDALATVRGHKRGWVQSVAQERFLVAFDEAIGGAVRREVSR